MTVHKKSGGVLEYLQTTLPIKALQTLYEDPSRGQFVCRAVLQQLSGPAQQIIIRMQNCGGAGFPKQGIQAWTAATPQKLEQMLREMQRWGIVAAATSPDQKADRVALTPSFAAGLRSSLCNLDAAPWQALKPVQLAALEQEAGIAVGGATTITAEDLERYTQEQWDAVLHRLVGTPGKKEPPPSMIALLLQTGLMRSDPDYKGRDPDAAPMVITESGYDFMLQDNHEQVWHFVLQYIKHLEKNNEMGEALQKEALLFLISLSFAQVGGAYLASALNKNCRTMMKHLSHFGLLYTRKIGKATLFYPTRVSQQLVGSSSSKSSAITGDPSTVWSMSNKALEAALSDPRPQDSSHLAIIVQTNFQLCAYTTSELHLSMLSLFCDDTRIRRLPNVVFMHITRDAVKSAFHRGIRARQILRFLEKHTHPKLRELSATSGATGTPVPANVVDQIWLWDRETVRVVFERVYQPTLQMGSAEYHALQQYCSDKGCLAYSSERRQQLLVDYRYFERVQAFVRQWRAQHMSRSQHE